MRRYEKDVPILIQLLVAALVMYLFWIFAHCMVALDEYLEVLFEQNKK